ncbi:MAG TPA: helix-turn-helix domain-containing protein [Tepidisphaeraceae bacterium]|nr:helix-turn-helix domain-containing protein [Tepidisphaeraceae bacterium]
MTDTPDYLPSGERLVLFVAFAGMCLLDQAGPNTVFWAASQAMHKRSLAGYRCHTVSMNGGLIQTAEGVAIQTQPVSDFEGWPIDTVMVPGSFSIKQVLPQSSQLVAWLRQIATRTRRMTSVCTGVYLLAEAGLLRGKRAATHWLMCEGLQDRFPEIEVDHDAIFVREGSVWTSAGVSACIDLSLALVEADCGRDVAMRVARELVVFLKRPGGQSQFSQVLELQTRDNGIFDELHAWIENNLASKELTVAMLAEQANMSPRNFARLYKSKTGRTPAKAIELFRLEAARRMLEDSDRNVTQIAKACGFGDEERMRMTFLRDLRVSPRDYRRRFSSTVDPGDSLAHQRAPA